MKKSLIALAALAAVTAASAQSTVTISGGLVLAVGSSKLDSLSTGTEILRQTGNIAFKGTEDLGGGLKAYFEVQTAIGAEAQTANTSADTVLGDRNAHIGVTGNFGTVQVGKAASAVRSLFGAIGDVSRLGVVNGISAGASTAPSTGSFTSTAAGDASARVIYGDAYAKYVSYTTPSISGFSAAVAMVPNRTNAATTDATSYDSTQSYSVMYANGPLSAAYNLTDAATTGATTITQAYKLHTILASYDFGIAKVGITSQTIKTADGVNPGNGISITANAPITSAGSIAFGYGKRSASASTDTRFGDDVKQTFIGYRHDLSKRTNVQFTLNKLNRNVSTGASTSDLTEQHVLLAHSF